MIIYKTINLITGKIYIGQDSKNNPNYYGGGLKIKHAIKKYGKHNFQKIILEQCDSYELLNSREKYWILKYNSIDPNIGYNIDIGGNGAIDRERWLENKKLNRKGGMAKGYKWKHESPLKGKKRELGTPWLLGENNPAKRSDVREKISKSKLGKPRPTNTCIYCGIVASTTNIMRWHNDNCKFKNEN
jgi:hypothetical protein